MWRAYRDTKPNATQGTEETARLEETYDLEETPNQQETAKPGDDAEPHRELSRETPEDLADVSAEKEILATGSKVIDLIAP